MEYTIDYFIDKFSAIPEEQWCIGLFHKNGKSCALGHCGVHSADIPYIIWNLEAKRLEILLDGISVVINDGGILAHDIYGKPLYATLLGTTPKKRILKALRLRKQGISILHYVKELTK